VATADFYQFTEQLQSSICRQVAWSLFSPDLFTHWPSPVVWDDWSKEWLQQLDESRWSPDLPKRLGFRFEFFLRRYFADHPQWDLLAHNFQIQDQGKTLGEIDFIVRNKISQEIMHLECAVKFYLAHPSKDLNRTEMDLWIGPNGQDRLDLKYQRLTEQQTQLSLRPTAIQQLTKSNIPIPTHTGIHGKGILFLPLTQGSKNSVKIPPWLNQKVINGHWVDTAMVKNEQFANSLNLHQWTALQKGQWLDPFYRSTSSFSDISFDAISHSVMLALTEDAIASDKTFSPRMFVVPEHWPGHKHDRYEHLS